MVWANEAVMYSDKRFRDLNPPRAGSLEGGRFLVRYGGAPTLQAKGCPGRGHRTQDM